MKRAAVDNTGSHGGRGLRRSTRRGVVAIKPQATHRETKNERQQEARAVELMATPLLQALPLVLGKSGFLYKHDCIAASKTCRNWRDIWAEAEEELPEYCQVQVQVELNKKEWPVWAKIRDLDTAIPTQAFAKQVFDKVNDLKVAAKPSKNKRLEARAALPKWGIDFHVVNIFVWGPMTRNRGGVNISLCNNTKTKYQDRLRNWMVRLDKDMVLWTGIRAWRFYDCSPLWEWNFNMRRLEAEGVGIDEEEGVFFIHAYHGQNDQEQDS